jgi:Family of unknown function (DUF6204)
VAVVSDDRIMRVTVRGRFGHLSPRATEYLRTNQLDHDVSNSAYTPEGTLTYDAAVDSFSLRYEIRLGADDPDGVAVDRGVDEAEHFLRAMGFDHRPLKVTVTDVAAAWIRP